MIIVAIIILLVIFSIVFSFMSPWQSVPIAADWGEIDSLLNATLFITGAVFAAVSLFMAYALYKYRNRAGHRADFEPENKRLELILSAVTSLGIIAMLAPGLVVWNKYITVPNNAVIVEVIGQQWSWTYRLPGKDGILGAVSTQDIYEVPFGLSASDPASADDILIDDGEIHLLLGQPVKMLLRSTDVLHDFYVPEFRAKMDLVPGIVTYFWLTPTRTGTFQTICAELCGVGHSQMRGTVVVEEAEAYNAWLAEQETYAELAAAERNDDVEFANITE
ncbi:MAG: cytochrome c oxidase subunit II [Rhodobacteraceae bacterium]|nr:cytochrome c oxidase subunit II [Paracoccaceae bacterium]